MRIIKGNYTICGDEICEEPPVRVLGRLPTVILNTPAGAHIVLRASFLLQVNRLFSRCVSHFAHAMAGPLSNAIALGNRILFSR